MTFPDLGADIDRVSLSDFEIVKIPKKNTHDPQVIDTIYQYRGNAGEFSVYKASDKYILYNFHIYGSSFHFKNGIKTGMSKSKLLETLNINASFTDTLTVEDTEGFSTVKFVFKNEKLINVKYCGYLD